MKPNLEWIPNAYSEDKNVQKQKEILPLAKQDLLIVKSMNLYHAKAFYNRNNKRLKR